jgi:AraC-like DNA-binding protein
VPTTSAQVLSLLLAEGRRRGAPVEALLRRVGLAGAEQLGPDARIPRPAEHRFWDELARSVGARDFGLEVAQVAVRSGAYGLLQYALGASGSLRAAGTWLERRLDVLYDGDEVLLEVGATSSRIGVRGPCRPGSRHSADCVLASFFLMARQWLGDGFQLEAVHFLHRRPRSTAGYAQVFGQAVLSFEAEWNAVTFSNRWLDAAFSRHDPGLFTLLEELAGRQQASRGSAEDPRLAVARKALVEGGFRLSAACEAIGVSPRTFQRLLVDSGTTFRAWCDAARCELARAYLLGPLPLEQVAARVGFRDANAFSRAFKRWTGLQPSVFRRRGLHAST